MDDDTEARMLGDVRARRIARNELLFRGVNERIHDASTPGLEDHHVLDVVCECSEAGCAKLISMSAAEYAHVRTDPRRFLIVPGHEERGIETVVERHANHHVVEKFGSAGDLAEQDAAADPGHAAD